MSALSISQQLEIGTPHSTPKPDCNCSAQSGEHPRPISFGVNPPKPEYWPYYWEKISWKHLGFGFSTGLSTCSHSLAQNKLPKLLEQRHMATLFTWLVSHREHMGYYKREGQQSGSSSLIYRTVNWGRKQSLVKYLSWNLVNLIRSMPDCVKAVIKAKGYFPL